jgi:hypothetical protein
MADGRGTLMGKSKLDRFNDEIMKKWDQGWGYDKITNWLNKERDFKISRTAVQHYLSKCTPSAGRRRDIVAFNMEKRLIKNTEKTLEQFDLILDDIVQKWDEVKNSLEPKSYESMLQQMIKAYELRAKLKGEITTGGNINFIIGTSDVKDKRFIEYTRSYVEGHHDKWDEWIAGFAKWEKTTYPTVTLKGEDIIDVESEELPPEGEKEERL